MANPNLNIEVIYPEKEPGVINNEIIRESIYNDYYKGEAGRLQRLEMIDYDNIKSIRLEFRNILRIDHLWVLANLTKLSLNFNKIDRIENLEMLTSLKELDLSFNCIEKIENLETLKSLEILSLFNNLITSIENLDSLENLLILSIGNNKIDSLNGIERFRYMKKIHCLNLEGNPIADDKENPLRIYIAAFLPNLKYYEYVYINDEQRKEGRTKYYHELCVLELNEQKIEESETDDDFLTECFVEQLNEFQLFDSLFTDENPNWSVICLIGSNVDIVFNQYRNQFYEITQLIYTLGLSEHKKRQDEFKEFEKCIENGKLQSQKEGQKVIQDFLEFKHELFEKAKIVVTKIEKFNLEYLDLDEDIDDDLRNEFDIVSSNLNDRMDEDWEILMEKEIYLYESIMDTKQDFETNLRNIMNEFLEKATTYFRELYDKTVDFSNDLIEIFSNYVEFSEKINIPKELKEFLNNSSIRQLVLDMRDYQIDKIRDRKNILKKNATAWLDKFMSDITDAEIKRNRAKIIEINYFLDQMREAFDQLQNDIHDEIFQDKE